MTRKIALLLVFLAASISAFGDIGFCPFFGNFSTPTGADGQTIAIPEEAPYLDDITLFSFDLYSNGGSGSRTPGTWYLLLAGVVGLFAMSLMPETAPVKIGKP